MSTVRGRARPSPTFRERRGYGAVAPLVEAELLAALEELDPARPWVLDLFCCAGGCSMGYYDAGYAVLGVDVHPRRSYPFPFVQADALEVLARHDILDRFALVHASPPCQAFTSATHARGNQDDHADLLTPTLEQLRAWGGDYIVENVPEAARLMPDGVLVCGWAVGLRHIRRHRWFGTNLPLMTPGCLCPKGDTVSVFGNSGEDRRRSTMAATGGMRKHVALSEVRELLGVPWISEREAVSECVPPAYTSYLAEQVLELTAGGAVA